MSTIRSATEKDAAACAALYKYYIQNSIATAQEKPWTRDDFQALIAKSAGSPLPFLVAIGDSGDILGYCYGSLLKNRCGYRHTYEISIYVAHGATGQGIGNALMSARLAATQNTPAYKLVAIISLPNPVSIALHEKFGFVYCGTLPGAVRKFNKWIDVGYWMLDVQKNSPENKSV